MLVNYLGILSRESSLFLQFCKPCLKPLVTLLFCRLFQQILGGNKGVLGEGNGNPLQCSCLDNPMDRGAWRATVRGIARVGQDWAAKSPTPPSPPKGSWLKILPYHLLRQGSLSEVGDISQLFLKKQIPYWTIIWQNDL